MSAAESAQLTCAAPPSVNNDPDYLRRISFNVALVSAVTPTGLTLAQPLIAAFRQAI